MVVQRLSLYLLGILLFSVVGCSAVQHEEEPIITTTPMVDKLKSITPPKRKVPIAVYNFGDKTGQRKPSDSLALLSTAVTQGGNGEWFQVIERIQLDQLLKERQIIRNTRKSYEGDKAQKVKPLLFAGVIIAGGIVGYDTDIISGGIGARYLGIGIHDEYRRDMVSIGLRLISVQTGEVLLAVSSEKTILSTRLGANVFKFLDMGTKLLETEAGISQNESVTYAVRKAIEAAVIQLIEDGEKNDLWEWKFKPKEKKK